MFLLFSNEVRLDWYVEFTQSFNLNKDEE